jgi:hypothetical protein
LDDVMLNIYEETVGEALGMTLEEFLGPEQDEFEAKPTIHESKVNRETKAKVCRLIDDIIASDEVGTWFFRSDTGTGKTLGFIQAVVGSDKTFAIAVPTRVDVEEVYGAIKAAGVEDVAYWHGDSKQRKTDCKDARVVVGTHKWLLGKGDDPTRHTGKRDLLIVDEVPTDSTANAIAASAFTKAREIAEAYNLKHLSSYRKAEEWAKLRYDTAEPKAYFKKVTFTVSKALKEAEKEVSPKRVPDVDERHALREVLAFLKAAADGRGYERREFVQVSKGWRNHYAWFEFPSEWFDKQVIFSATSHLDGFQFHRDASRLEDVDGALVDYTRLQFVQVPWPKISKHPKAIQSDPQERMLALEHIKECVKLGKGKTLVVLPKMLKKDCVASFSAEVVSQETYLGEYDGRTIYITNWGRDVGSNEYRECETVVLWSNTHKPKHSTFSELLAMAKERVNDDNLSEVKGGKLQGRPLNLKEGQLYAAIKQMGCRGNARNVDDDGLCADMTIIMTWDELDPRRLQGIFPNCQFSEHRLDSPKFSPKVKRGIEYKVLDVLNTRFRNDAEVPLALLAQQVPNVSMSVQN